MPAMHMIVVEDDSERQALLVGDGITAERVIHTTADWTLATLPQGMSSGRTSLAVFIPIPGTDRVLAAETSLNAWQMATAVLVGAFGDELSIPGWAELTEPAKAALRPRYIEAIRRAIPGVTEPQIAEAVELLLDSLGAGRDS